MFSLPIPKVELITKKKKTTGENMRRKIIVARRKGDPKAFTTQKYSNDEPWNVVGGTAPEWRTCNKISQKNLPGHN
jgi:K+/H+ antiporter YhaU regulatory subunit KhtT